jgi:ABC-type sulfate transport system permease component
MGQEVNLTWTIVAWIVTVLLIPLLVLFWKSESKRVADALAAKERLDIERHTTLASLVTERHAAIMAKLSSYCQQNGREHEELFTERRLHGDRITAIEQTHKLKGCDHLRV